MGSLSTSEWEAQEDKLDWESAPDSFREHVKKLGTDLKDTQTKLATQDEELVGYRKQQAFDKAIKEAEVEGISLEDLGDVKPEDINPTFLKVKAEERKNQQQEVLAQQAKVMGFEKVEDYQAALEKIKAEKAVTATNQQTQQVVASGGSPPPPEGESPKEKAWKQWEEDVKARIPRDVAQARYVETLRRAAYPEEAQPPGG